MSSKISNSFSKRPTSTSKRIRNVILRYESEISGIIVLLALAAYLLNYRFASQCLFASHEYAPNAYGKGTGDCYFVVFWTISFTFFRATFIKYCYLPLANHFNIAAPSKRQRAAEQSYILGYYTIFGAAGLYNMYRGPHWFSTSHYWIGYPHILISRDMKYYYLMQLAFWFQQLYVLHIEERRKDHIAMLSHHIITIALVWSSYYTNLTRVGNAVLCCMDISDIFLSLAKILKYLGFTNICNVSFGLFAVSWPITRHLFFSIITWSVAIEPARYIDMKWDPDHGKYFTIFTQKIFVGLLLMLNAIMFYWFLLIIKVIVRLFTGVGTDDPRSDDEDESDDTCLEKDQFLSDH